RRSNRAGLNTRIGKHIHGTLEFRKGHPSSLGSTAHIGESGAKGLDVQSRGFDRIGQLVSDFVGISSRETIGIQDLNNGLACYGYVFIQSTRELDYATKGLFQLIA